MASNQKMQENKPTLKFNFTIENWWPVLIFEPFGPQHLSHWALIYTVVPLDTIPKASLRLPLYTCKVTTYTVVPVYSTSLCWQSEDFTLWCPGTENSDPDPRRCVFRCLHIHDTHDITILLHKSTYSSISISSSISAWSPHPSTPHPSAPHPLLSDHPSPLFIHLIPIHFYLLLHLHNLLFILFHLLLPHLLIHLHLLLLRIQVDLDQDAPQLPSSISSFSK